MNDQAFGLNNNLTNRYRQERTLLKQKGLNDPVLA
jgi:hypothetical protein